MTELETGSFDAVIDKGLTDSIMYNDKFALMMAKVSLRYWRHDGATSIIRFSDGYDGPL